MSAKLPPDDRKSRLAEALRENLKRRKAQARARASNEPEGEAPENPDAANPPQSPPKER